MQTINNRDSGNKTLLWIAGGCLVVLVCIIGAIVLGFGGLYWLGSQSPENVTVQVEIPSQAQVGDPFEFDITVTNSGPESVQLFSTAISMNFLNGIIIDRTNPQFTETNQYDALGGGETFINYYFSQSIAPGETLKVVFSGKAVSTGVFSGNMDVCINSDFNCITNVARTVIK
jgi:hypothetical protein